MEQPKPFDPSPFQGLTPMEAVAIRTAILRHADEDPLGLVRKITGGRVTIPEGITATREDILAVCGKLSLRN